MKLNFVGDFMPINTLEKAIADNHKIVDKEFAAILKDSDYNIINLECPLTDSTKTTLKTGKNFKSNKKSIDFLNKHQFNIACLANNHMLDYGIDGLEDTEKICKENNIASIGIKDTNNTISIFRSENSTDSFSIINAAENEFGIATETHKGVFAANPENLFYTIKQEKEKSKFVILVVHGGREFYPLPTPKRQNLYRLFIDFGADMIISHHTHVPSGFEIYKEKPIIYSLGNFLFPYQNHYNKEWYEGLICQVEIKDGTLSHQLIPFIQDEKAEKIRLLQGEQKISFNRKLEERNKQINNSKLLHEAWIKFIENEELQYFHMLKLIDNFKLKLYYKKILKNPPTPKQKELITVLNLLRCQSHRTESIAIITNYLKNNNPSFYN